MKQKAKSEKYLGASGGDDWIRSVGNMTFVNTFLKYSLIVVLLVVVAEAIVIFNLALKVNEVKVMPIFIDRESGSARPVDFDVIDAAGERRPIVEIHDFCINYINNLHYFNIHTIETNLKRAFRVTASAAQNDLKNALMLSDRYDQSRSNMQGICDIKSFTILESKPNLKVEVVFKKKIVTAGGEIFKKTKHKAIMKLKTVKRMKGNAHGFYVNEYRENKILED